MSTSMPKYHPAFQVGQFQDDDIDLLSSDDVLYRLPAFILPPQCFTPSPSSIPIDASSDALTPLLLMLSGLPSGLMSQRFMEDPLAVYALASRCGWDAEAVVAARKTLSLDLYAEEHAAILESMPAGAVVRLFQYHRARRDVFREIIGEGFDEKCSGCGAKADGGEWRTLRARMITEIENGNEEGVCSLEMEEWGESEACWGAKCKECGAAVYDRIATLRRIREAVAGLPTFK
ncbi:hypothetical protein BDZ89DRAFT_1064480 [Hymenopellis radicata]|nr:hypothetical protein BDZ89DRAFT_1064480 [Hymenopellis radicata]